jgi:radical SAM superfamily enzyme YgiQ (UPF0313 family)
VPNPISNATPNAPMNGAKVVLISTYELGRQPFGLASPAAWLRERGHEVSCFDLSRQALDEGAIRAAGLIAFYVPMHTATRLTLELLPAIRGLNPDACLCAYGLYAPLAAESFQALGVSHLFGGEFEQALSDLADQSPASGIKVDSLQHSQGIVQTSLARQRFLNPDRSGLPSLRSYAHLVLPQGGHRVVGYTEASRGCKHLCRHCPIVPVYNGVFRIVDREVVLADIRQQVAAGAEHITFGDPDFLNGPGHVIPLIESLHAEFPNVTFDATIKVEHLLRHATLLPVLRDTGCLFITSAVESLSDRILEKLDKGHTREDFFRAVEEVRGAGIALHPTFVPFTPWTTVADYIDLLDQIRRLGLVSSVASIQLAIRLLLPAGSRLLELEEIRACIGPFDSHALVYPWKHEDPGVDALAAELQVIVSEAEQKKFSREVVFEKIWRATHKAAGNENFEVAPVNLVAGDAVPYLNEPWYC